MNLADLTYEKARALKGTAFRVELPDGTDVAMRLEDVRPHESRHRRASGVTPKRDPFSVYFVGPVRPILPQSIYALGSEQLTLKLFIVPIGQDGTGTKYEAVFT